MNKILCIFIFCTTYCFRGAEGVGNAVGLHRPRLVTVRRYQDVDNQPHPSSAGHRPGNGQRTLHTHTQEDITISFPICKY